MDDERKFPVFREEVADVIWEAVVLHLAGKSIDYDYFRYVADEILTRLRQLGAFHVDALTAIKEQEKE